MNEPRRPDAKCNHDDCRRPFRDHPNGQCPKYPGREFAYHTPRVAGSNSFNEREVNVLHTITSGLQRGQRDFSVIVRSKEFVNVARKVLAMKAQVERIKRERGE